MKSTLLLGPLGLSSTVAGAFMGMGGANQQPYCALACRTVLGNANLTCTMMPHMGAMMMAMTTADCRANDDAFLTSLAYCFEAQCVGVPVWQLEQYWAAGTTGTPGVIAKWNYQTALEHINGTPTSTWMMGHTLNTTMLVPPAPWGIWNHFLFVMDHNTILLYRYALIILVVGFATPIAITILSKLPGVSALFEKLNPYLVWPSTIGTYHNRSLPWQMGNPPTVGQALYIAGFIILNVILSCVGYVTQQPNPWGYNKRGEILAYAGYRTGEFAFALLPLTILFAGRNNILLWLTNWSHSTYILLHRWIARLFALHTILHSVFLLAARIQTGTYRSDKELAYWQWGIVGTVFVSVMLVWSLLWMRRLAYEVFLIGHIIMAIFTIVGSWCHLVLRFGYGGNHEYWLYAAVAVWGFDRILRILRIIGNGVRRSTVTEVGPNHVRVEIPGIRFSGKPSFHGYVYFPTLSPLKPWENHPFSVNSTALIHSYRNRLPSPANSVDGSSGNDKTDAKVHASQADNGMSTTAGITLYVRKSTGMTRLLQKHANLLTLFDGPYPNNSPTKVLNCDRLLLIGGGIGITGLLGFLHAHINVKFAWSVKQTDEAIVHDLDSVLQSVVDREIRVGERLDVNALLRQEAQAGYKKVGVVACGPAGLCDDVRAMVSSLGRHEKIVFELEVDTFGW